MCERGRFLGLVESFAGGLNAADFVHHLFELRRRNVPDGLKQPAVIEPVDPFKDGELRAFNPCPPILPPAVRSGVIGTAVARAPL